MRGQRRLKSKPTCVCGLCSISKNTRKYQHKKQLFKMNIELLHSHLANFIGKLGANPSVNHEQFTERQKRVNYYQSWARERILAMTPENVYDYLSPLWAMLIWGNKHY